MPEFLGDVDVATEVQRTIDFFDTHNHMFISQGPFRIVEIDEPNMVMEFERWTIEDGYPFSEEYWDKITASVSISLVSPTENDDVYIGTEEEITWESENPLEDGLIKLEYSTDGGDNWTVIAEDVRDRGVYSWAVPEIRTNEAMIRITLSTEKGDFYYTSGLFKIIGSPPEFPLSLEVDHHQDGSIFYDDVLDGDIGYINDEWQGASDWDIRQNGAYIGNSSWDFGDCHYIKGNDQGWLSWLISPEIYINNGTSANLTFHHWRAFSYLHDGGNLRISTDGQDGPWEIIHPEDGYDGTIVDGYDNPLGGEPGWGYEYDWEKATFNLDEYIGETIHLNWSAGTEDWDGDYNEGWRIDNLEIYVENIEDNIDNSDHNILRWNSSTDDGGGNESVTHYNIYRSQFRDGPWDDNAVIDTIIADSSPEYQYVDEDKGMADDVYWWYMVRAVDINNQDDGNTYAKQEPGAEFDIYNVTLSLNEGSDNWNFVSFNLIPLERSLHGILNAENGITDNFDKVMYYDREEDEWLSYMPDRAEHFNDEIHWDHTMGLWIRMTQNDTLTIEGTVPISTDIVLEPGWNMVGYPSTITGNNDLPVEVSKLGYFDAQQEYNIAYESSTSNFNFEPGKAYWIYNEADQEIIWNIVY